MPTKSNQQNFSPGLPVRGNSTSLISGEKQTSQFTKRVNSRKMNAGNRYRLIKAKRELLEAEQLLVLENAKENSPAATVTRVEY
jgi:hypothetical protein